MKVFFSTVLKEELFVEVSRVKEVLDNRKVFEQLTQNLMKNGFGLFEKVASGGGEVSLFLEVQIWATLIYLFLFVIVSILLDTYNQLYLKLCHSMSSFSLISQAILFV